MKNLLLPLALLLSQLSFAQTYNINNGGTHNTCSGTLLDSDIAAGNYTPNEDYTITLCVTPGGGNVLNVNFTSGFMTLAAGDTLFVHDGPSVADPVITFYTFGTPASQVTSSTSNASGCLTFHFVSDATTEDAGFNGLISCSDACQPIDPQVVAIPQLVSYAPDSNYIYACPGDTIALSASGLYPTSGLTPNHYIQSDATSLFEWDFGDGTTVNGQNASHVYANEQGYFASLRITDVNGCYEDFEFKVFHSITPKFSGIDIDPDRICDGDSVVLHGGFNASSSMLFGASQDSGHATIGGSVAGVTFLPDGSGNQYSTSVSVSGFPGQTITSAADIQELCVTIEHSYLGDLEMMLTCPNGTSVAIFDSYGPGGMLPNGFGGGGTYLGQPDDFSAMAPGIGWEYCFYDAAINPPWATTYPTTPVTTPSPGNSVVAGDYQPETSFANLIGCPINGNWTLTVQDNLFIDNGYIFEWSITMNPAISPVAEAYLPLVTNAYWDSDPTIYDVDDSTAFAAPIKNGYTPYTFIIEDDFGCTFDTTLHVYMMPVITANAGVDTITCPDVDLQLNGSATVDDPESCLYTIKMTDSGFDGWSGAELHIRINGLPAPGSPFSVNNGNLQTVAFAVNSGDNIVAIFEGGLANNEIGFVIQNGNGTPVFTGGPSPTVGTVWTSTANCGNSFNYSFNWTPSSNLSNPTVKNPVFNGSNPQTLTMTAGFTGSGVPACAVSDMVKVDIETFPIPEIQGDLNLCLGELTTLTVTNGTGYLWHTGDTIPTLTFFPLEDSAISILVQTVCPDFLLEDTIFVHTPTVLNAGSDTTIYAETSVALSATGGGAQYTWQPPTGLDCFTCPDPIASPSSTTTYVVTMLDSNGCKSSDVITVYVEYLPLFIPSAFSPNGDGSNDILYLRGAGVKSMNLLIYDRYGSIVFHSSSRENGWDGTIDGKPASSGVYAYQCTVTRGDGIVEDLKGNITLVR